jgi:hypothetical protein
MRDDLTRLLGILEGNGNVTLSVSPSNRYSTGFQVSMGFEITNKSDAYLVMVNELLKQNQINARIIARKLVITQKEDLRKLVEYSEHYGFRNKQKEKEFCILKDCLNIHDNRNHKTMKGIEELQNLKKELNKIKEK